MKLTKTQIKAIVATAITMAILFLIFFGGYALGRTNCSRMEPITNFTDVELAKGETCRLEILLPIAKTLDGVGVIFADEGGNLWEMTDFYAEENDVFVALMNDKGTKTKTDDQIVDIWLDLE